MMRIFKPKPRHTSPSTPVTLTVDRLSHDGRGIASRQGKTVFIRGALPGETVSAVLQRSTSRYDEYRLLAVETPSPERVTPPCPWVGQCGGCALQHAAPTLQQQLRQDTLAQQLRHFGQVTPGQWLPPLQDAHTHYRHRVKFSVTHDRQGRAHIGFRERASHAMTEIDSCLLLMPGLNRALACARQWLAGHPLPSLQAVEFALDDHGHLGVLFMLEQWLEAHDKVWQTLSTFATALQAHSWSGQSGRRRTCATPESPLHLVLPVQSIDLAYLPGDFTQVNPAVNRAMVSQALTLLAPGQDDHVLDYFCGIGNFSLPLAGVAGRVTGYELSQAMVERAGSNARVNGLENADFQQADLFTQTPVPASATLALIDPPREGAEQLCQALARTALRRIVYVSCNPSTLARDAGHLLRGGYKMQAAGQVDMFPHTSHSEAMAVFVRE